MLKKIEVAMLRAGLDSFPITTDEPLRNPPVDSLLALMMILEIEKEFNIKIDTDKVAQGTFANLNSVIQLIETFGGGSSEKKQKAKALKRA